MVKSVFHKLCSLIGVSGSEDEVREFILNEIRTFADIKTDTLGNIIVFKKGEQRAARRVMFTSHMDEVGLIITKINDEGYLKFATVGGIDARVLIGKRIKVGRNKIAGCIGICPVHLLTKEEKEKAPEMSALYIDIGALSREDALKYVQEGDIASFDSDFVEFGEGFIKCKAFDNRSGCALLIDMIKAPIKYDTYFSFNVQEEVGLRGALTATYEIKPDICVVVEATTAADFGSIKGAERVCFVNGGPVISFMDKQTLYDRKLYSFAVKMAEENNIKWQTKTDIVGGNDAGSVQRSLAGVRVLAVSLPCRYIHTPSCVANIKDFDETAKLLNLLCEKLGGESNV